MHEEENHGHCHSTINEISAVTLKESPVSRCALRKSELPWQKEMSNAERYLERKDQEWNGKMKDARGRNHRKVHERPVRSGHEIDRHRSSCGGLELAVA